MSDTVANLCGVGMAPAMAKLLGTDGANGAPAQMLQHVGMPAPQARLLGSDMPGGGHNVPMRQLCNVGMPPAHALRLGV